MKKLFIAFAIAFTAIPSINAQTERLNDYSFVVVPQQFEFQYEKDQYQLNSLLKFLLNKHGFHAYFENELPNISRCSGLWAEVTGKPGFIWNEVIIYLKDCDGVLLFKSMPGKSKLKDYGDGYTEALRMAFESISALGVRQKEVRLLVNPEETDSRVTETKPMEAVEGKDSLNRPTSTYTNYSLNEDSYLLRKTNSGYSFYKEHNNDEEGLSYVGKLFLVDDTLFFEDAEEVRYTAAFDENGNFSIARDGVQKTYTKN